MVLCPTEKPPAVSVPLPKVDLSHQVALFVRQSCRDDEKSAAYGEDKPLSWEEEVEDLNVHHRRSTQKTRRKKIRCDCIVIHLS